MRKWVGIICIVLGVICLLAAIGFVVYNRWEEDHAQKTTREILENLQSIVDEPKPEQPQPETPVSLPSHAKKLPAQMATVQVDGYDCIGILCVPVLELELPVLTDWSYVKLKKAPCHYYGTCYETDFVIAAHNFESHFGRLSQLQAGDLVVFTDVNGVDYYYEVVLLETLPPTATEEMITSGFDLSLYTCTPGGGNRVTVRCSRKETV